MPTASSSGDSPLPATLSAWTAARERHLATAQRLLGDLPPLFTPTPRTVQVEQRDGYRLETFTFENEADDLVHGYLCIPDGLHQPAPALLYLHAHGGKFERGKEELFHDSPMGVSPVANIMAAGYVLLTIDCYAFGARARQAPNGAAAPGRDVEMSWFKKHLWEGRTLWGMIVRDDMLALNVLLARPEVDPTRVVATGMSLGGSRTTWLAALDDRITLALPVAQMTRYRDFAAAGDFTHHSVYYYVPGALVSGIDMETLTSLTAPRRQVILIGDSDPLSPVGGVRTIDAYTQHIYSLYGAADQFETVLYPGVAHAYTPEMYRRLLRELT